MNLFKKLFGRAPAAKAIESILIVEDRALYLAIRDATDQQRRRAAIAVARHVVSSVALKHSVVTQGLACLEAGENPSPSLIAAVEQLAEELDLEDCRQQEERETGECQGAAASVAFHQARAASCIASALSGRTDEAVYEAIHATEDLPGVREIVLSALV